MLFFLCFIRGSLQSSVQPIVPNISDYLYESAYEGQLWMLFDANKKLISTGDAFPADWKVKSVGKGDYTLRLQVSVEYLETWEQRDKAG